MGKIWLIWRVAKKMSRYDLALMGQAGGNGSGCPLRIISGVEDNGFRMGKGVEHPVNILGLEPAQVYVPNTYVSCRKGADVSGGVVNWLAD